MTPEQKQKLDEIRNRLAEKYSRFLEDNKLARFNCSKAFSAGFDDAIKHLMPAIEALEYWAKETEWMNVPKEFQIERASKALEKIFGNEMTSEAGDEK